MITEDQIQTLAASGSDWRAALFVIRSPAFQGDNRVWKHVTREGINFSAILRNRSFSGGEYQLLTIARSLFNGGGTPNLWRAFGVLSDEWAEIALDAMRIKAGLDRLAHFRVIADGREIGFERGRNVTQALMRARGRPEFAGKRIVLEELDGRDPAAAGKNTNSDTPPNDG